MDIENNNNSNHTSSIPSTSTNGKRWYSGNVSMRRDHMDILPALENGLIKDWDVVEQLLNHTFDSCLRINSKEHPILMAESNFNTREAREKMTELLFEKYGTPGAFLSKNAVLSAFFQGKYTGIVVDCGSAVTSVVPVCEGYALQKAIVKSNLAGDRLTDEYHYVLENQSSSSSSSGDTRIKPRYMISRKEISPGEFRVTEVNYPNVTESYKTYMTKDIVRDLKESVSKIDISGESTAANLPSIPYELPDGSVLEIGHERFSVPEILFRPSTRKLNAPTDNFSVGLTQMIENSVAMCDLDIRKDMALNIIVCGGTSMLSNFPDRLTKELQELTTSMKYRLVPVTPERKWSVFIGGSILGSLGTFQQMWISKLQYEEHGASVVERKCP
eukprot:TRINITY_DN40_c0_g1_i2.p1 TRINITY_DN40_c0_g1~~TRINITY_DN40_c0_g1_i2.p1  ORF type:complete len:387 (+),score=86.78 TRINITY_DN40_c0_g1_i2:407-1567(+)